LLEGPITLARSGRAVTIGRDADSDVELTGERTSRRHAELRIDAEGPVLRDMGSRNGIFVNGVRGERLPLAKDDLVRIGDSVGIAVTLDADQPPPPWDFREIVPGYWAGPVLSAAIDPLKKIAPTDLPVVIEGETGTGKEGAALAIHRWSGRTGALVALNCAALPEPLAEAELFGYRKGAFTGAEQKSIGHIRAAHAGTLLLDEISELPLPLQAKLLRAIEQRTVVPLGESTPVDVDVRYVAAAQAPLRDEVEQKSFRGDLYARLGGLTVRLPPLRQRRAEIPFLALRMFEREAKGRPIPAIDPAFVEALCLYDWPFNVRELDRIVRQVWALHGDRTAIGRTHLPDRLVRPAARPEPKITAEPDVATLTAALREAQGNVKRAAAALGISRQKAYRLIEQAGEIDLSQMRRPSDPPA
jgi:transcriptional regulator with PAS, ATPase and Fis domain